MMQQCFIFHSNLPISGTQIIAYSMYNLGKSLEVKNISARKDTIVIFLEDISMECFEIKDTPITTILPIYI